MNFHLAKGIYFRREGDTILIVKAKDFDDLGEVLVATDINGLASVVASASPHQEQNGSFDYICKFLKDGTMYCGGCGAEMKPGTPIAGTLSIVNRTVCMLCYEQKFKPLFDWALPRKKTVRTRRPLRVSG